MSRFLNNLCEDLVNGSNPRYAGSKPSLSEQVAWQLKKEEEARQALFAESMKKFEEQMRAPAPTYTPNYSAPTYIPEVSSTSHLSHLSNLSGLPNPQSISYSTPSYSTPVPTTTFTYTATPPIIFPEVPTTVSTSLPLNWFLNK